MVYFKNFALEHEYFERNLLATNNLLVSVSRWNSWLEPFRFHVSCFHFRAAVSFMRGQRNYVRETVFRFTCVECSAVEVTWLAQNIRHGNVSVRLLLAAFRCLI